MMQRDGYATTDDGIRLFFQAIGDGPQTVMIPNGICMVDDFAHLTAGRTLIFYDLRNRGRSDQVVDATKRERGIQHDVDDLDAVRRHFKVERFDLIGHSYVGMTVALCAAKYADRIDRVVQIGPMPPVHGRQYPPHLTNEDETLRAMFARVGELQKDRQSTDPVAFCRRFWELLRVIYVADPVHAAKVNWGRCELPNERGFMRYWLENIQPSIQRLALTAADFAHVKAQTLIVHGTKDRSSPYGGGREWALMLPNARLVTIEGVAHAPWIEAPEPVFDSIRTFLDGHWPEAAERVTSL